MNHYNFTIRVPEELSPATIEALSRAEQNPPLGLEPPALLIDKEVVAPLLSDLMAGCRIEVSLSSFTAFLEEGSISINGVPLKANWV